MRTLSTIEPIEEAIGDTVGPIAADSPREFVPTCTVVICTRDRPVQLDQCLEAVSRLVYPDFDVLVVDNASADARTREVAARWKVRYVSEATVGLSRARNRGFRECDTQVVAFLDDDALPNPDWLSFLAREFEDPRVMAVAGDKRALRMETEAERLSALLDKSYPSRPEHMVVDRQTPSWFERANFGGIGDGMNMAFRRRAMEFWPGFDERLGRGAILHGGEEHHAFFSLIDQGYRTVYTPDAIVRHPYPRTMQDLRTRHLRDLAASTGYFALLFVEEPRYRQLVIKYLTQALAGVKRAWRAKVAEPQPYSCIAPWWRRLLACSAGPLLYARSRFAHSPPARTRASSNMTNARLVRELDACQPNDL